MNIRVLRKEIDRIDARMLVLLNGRLRIARRIGILKQSRGHRWVDPRRERAILARLRRANRGPLSSSSLGAIYRQIFLTTRAVQRHTVHR